MFADSGAPFSKTAGHLHASGIDILTFKCCAKVYAMLLLCDLEICVHCTSMIGLQQALDSVHMCGSRIDSWMHPMHLQSPS